MNAFGKLLFGARKSVAFAAKGARGLFVRCRYDGAGGVVVVDFAEGGAIEEHSEGDLIGKLARRFHSTPVWVPVYVENIGQQNDIRVIGLDGVGRDTSRRDIIDAADTQLQGVEADDKVEYAHTIAMRRGQSGDSFIGGSIPAAIMRRTFEYWRKRRGYRRPRIGSRHVSIANLFLALHPRPAGDARDDGYTLLSLWTGDIDFFCFLKGDVLLDCGNSSVGADAGFYDHMDHLSSWARDFMERHHVNEAESFRACVMCPDKVSAPDDFEVDGDKLEFWDIPWDRVRASTPEVGAALSADRELAAFAIGLSLHGI